MSPFLPLAEFTPFSPAAQLAIVSLLVVAGNVATIAAAFRRKPPLDSELTKINAAVKALTQSVASLEQTAKSQATHAKEIESLQSKVRELERGREQARQDTDKVFLEVFRKIDGLRDSLATNFQSVERAMGRIEGEVKQLSGRMG